MDKKNGPGVDFIKEHLRLFHTIFGCTMFGKRQTNLDKSLSLKFGVSIIVKIEQHFFVRQQFFCLVKSTYLYTCLLPIASRHIQRIAFRSKGQES